MKISIDQLRLELNVSMTFKELSRIRKAEQGLGEETVLEKVKGFNEGKPKDGQMKCHVAGISWQERELLKKLKEVENAFDNYTEAKRVIENHMRNPD